MNEEELKSITEHFKYCIKNNVIRDEEYVLMGMETLLNLIEKQQEKLKKYKFNMGVICEYCIDVSKGHINANNAIEGIGKYIYWGQ